MTKYMFISLLWLKQTFSNNLKYLITSVGHRKFNQRQLKCKNFR